MFTDADVRILTRRTEKAPTFSTCSLFYLDTDNADPDPDTDRWKSGLGKETDKICNLE